LRNDAAGIHARGHDVAAVVHLDRTAVVRGAAVTAHGRHEVPLLALILRVLRGCVLRAAAEREVERHAMGLAAVAATAADALRIDRVAPVAERLDVALVADADVSAGVSVPALPPGGDLEVEAVAFVRLADKRVDREAGAAVAATAADAVGVNAARLPAFPRDHARVAPPDRAAVATRAEAADPHGDPRAGSLRRLRVHAKRARC